jgi:hypothetical protein
MLLRRQNVRLRERIFNLETLVDYLRNTPEVVAKDTLRRLRDTPDINSMLASGVFGTGNGHISRQPTSGSIPLLTYIQYDVVSMLQHPILYPPLESPVNDLLQNHQLMKRQRLNKSIPENTFLDSNSEMKMLGADMNSTSHSQQIPQSPDIYLDARLQQLKITFWTSVPVTNQYAAGAIALYLITDHPFLSLFDPELFVGDLITERLDFCSPFLVSSLLAFASVSQFNLRSIVKLVESRD